MAEKTLVRPVQGKSGFVNGATLMGHKPDGSKHVMRNYEERQFITGSNQGRRPRWRKALQAYGIDMPLKELNQRVARLGWRDKNGNLIESADPKNPNDAFFNHDKLGLLLQSGNFDGDVPMQEDLREILMASMRARTDVVTQSELEQMGGSTTPEQKLTITTETEMDRSKNKQISTKVQASTAFSKAIQSMARAKIVAKMLDISFSNDIEPERLQNLIYEDAVDNGDQKAPLIGGLPKRTSLVMLSEMSDEELVSLDTLTTAIKKNIVETRKDGYLLKGVKIADPQPNKIDLLRTISEEVMDEIDIEVNKVEQAAAATNK